MDGTRFDDLARELASGVTRRRFLRSLAGGAVAMMAGARVVADTSATCTPPGPRNFCNADSDCCAGAICRFGACRCGAGFKQCGSRCVSISTQCGVCPTGYQHCDGQCRNVQSDRYNCGSCHHACPANQTCSGGHCCPKGTIFCEGSCKMASQCLPEI